METTQNSFKLLKKIKDPIFSIENLEFFNLSLVIGDRDMQVLVTDVRDSRCLLLEDYMFAEHQTDVQKVEIIKDLYEDHHLLMAGFWNSVTVGFKSRHFSFIPSDFYDKLFTPNYLKLNSELDEEQNGLVSTFHKKHDFVNVFSAPKRIVKYFISRYPNLKIRFVHQSSSIVSGFSKKSKEKPNSFGIFVDRFVMHICVFVEGKLLIYNQYPIKKFEDYLKYIKIVSQELNINYEDCDILLYGFLGKKTPHYVHLKKLIPNLELGDRPKKLNFGYVFDEISDHQYFDVLSMYAARNSLKKYD